MENSGSPARPKAEQGSLAYMLFGVILLGGILLLATWLHVSKASDIGKDARARESDVKAGPRVNFVMSRIAPPERSVELVGEARPYLQSTLYAKVSGYLRDIKVDYGDKVGAGQILAIIESPELDRQYEAAVADATNKELLAKRGWALLPQKAISIEEAQNREYAAQTAKATAASLLAQKEYEIIRAPFSGIVTTRFADPGALLQNATTTQTAALPLVTLSEVGKLKVYAYSNQSVAGFIQVGDRAEIWDATRSEERVPAAVSRTSVQLSARTRTLLIQFDVDNGKNLLVPGSFVRVALKIKTPPRVEVPVEALVYRSGNPFVAVINEKNTVDLRQVAIAFSDGTTARLLSGVREGERVAMNLGAGVAEGDTVQPVETRKDAR